MAIDAPLLFERALAAETARPGRTTHTICDDCVADLRATGRSA